MPRWREVSENEWLLGDNRRVSITETSISWSIDTLGTETLCYQLDLAEQPPAHKPFVTVVEDALSFSLTPHGRLSLAVLPGFINLGEWTEVDPNLEYRLNRLTNQVEVHARTPVVYYSHDETEIAASEVLSKLESLIECSLRHICSNQEAVDVLFSGGIDSSLIARLACRIVPKVRLWNVSFASAEAPDRLTGLLSYVELCRICKSTERFEFYARDVSKEEHEQEKGNILKAIWPKKSLMDFTIGSTLYFASQLKGRLISYGEAVQLTEPVSEEALNDVANLLCRRNVKLEKEVKEEQICGLCEKLVVKHSCTMRACKRCCTKRGKADTLYKCGPHQVNNQVVELPHSELELCLRYRWKAIYESKPAVSFIDVDVDNVPRYILCGNGADELFGGYSRYKTCEMHGSLDGWREEMVRDLQRLWLRNFSRDGRVLLAGSNGKVECRLPYMNRDLIAFVAALSNKQLWNGVDMCCDVETGNNKALLRQLCLLRLDMQLSGRFRKRAMQFGSRSAMSIFDGTETSRRSFKGESEWICP